MDSISGMDYGVKNSIPQRMAGTMKDVVTGVTLPYTIRDGIDLLKALKPYFMTTSQGPSMLMSMSDCRGKNVKHSPDLLISTRGPISG